jgi:hypothetical protein
MQNEVSYCTTELRFCRKEGGVLWIEAFARPIEGRNGEPAGVSGMLIDITASAKPNRNSRVPRKPPRPPIAPEPDGMAGPGHYFE